MKISHKNTILKGQLDPISEAYIITIYAKNIENVEDARLTIAHEILHITHPDWDEEKIEIESKVLAESENFRRWLCQKAREYQSLYDFFQSILKSQSTQ